MSKLTASGFWFWFRFIIIVFLLSVFNSLNLSSQEAELRVAFPSRNNRLLDCAISRDGLRALTVDRTGVITLWDVETQKGIRSFQASYGAAHIAFLSNPDYAFFLSSSSREGSDLYSYFIGIINLKTGSINYSEEIEFAHTPNLDLSKDDWLVLENIRKVYMINLKRGFIKTNEKWNPTPLSVNLEEDVLTAFFDPVDEQLVRIITQDSTEQNAHQTTARLTRSSFETVQIIETVTTGPLDYSNFLNSTITLLENDTFYFRDLKYGYSGWILKDSIAPVFADSTNNDIRDFSFSPDGSMFVISFGAPTTIIRSQGQAMPRYYGGMYIIDSHTHRIKYKHFGVEKDIEYRMVPKISWTEDSKYLLRVNDGFKASIHDMSAHGSVSHDFTWYLQKDIYYDVDDEVRTISHVSHHESNNLAGYWPLDDIHNKFVYDDPLDDIIKITRNGDLFITGKDYSESGFQLWAKNEIRSLRLTGKDFYNGIYSIEDLKISDSKSPMYVLFNSFGDMSLGKVSVETGIIDTLLLLKSNSAQLFERLELSKNNKYLTIATKGSFSDDNDTYFIYDMNTGSEKMFASKNDRRILKNDFSDSHDLAVTKFSDASYIIWSTVDGRMSHSGNLPNASDHIIMRHSHQQVIEIFREGIIKLKDIVTLKNLDSVLIDPMNFMDPIVSGDGRFLYLKEESDQFDHFIIVDLEKGLTIVEETRQRRYLWPAFMDRCHFSDDNFAITGDLYGNLQLWDLEKEDVELITDIKILNDNNWAVHTTQGTFDGSEEGRDMMYYVVDNKVVEFDQLKDRFWVPDLLTKILNREYEPEQYTGFESVPLYPDVALDLDDDYDSLTIRLVKNSGGIGTVNLFVNGVERNVDINLQRDSTIHVVIEDYWDYLESDKINTISIQAFDASGQIHSRPETVLLDLRGTGERGSRGRIPVNAISAGLPKLYALFIGTSRYDDARMRLQFPDKDAIAMESAFRKIGSGIFGDRIQTFTLTSVADTTDKIASKNNIMAALHTIQDSAKANDVIIIFMSGHGVTLDDDFYYLTKDLGGRDKNNIQVRKSFLISSRELKEEIRKIKSHKQVLILDACHSGQTAQLFSGSKSANTSQKKALESLEGKMGVYVLASSEGNQLSYESVLLNQGILTYSLLMGLSGGAINDMQDSLIEIGRLLTYASQQSELLAKKVKGKTQTPVLGTKEGGSSFPVGIVNDQVNFKLPDNVLKIGSPRIGTMPAFLDSLELESGLIAYLKEYGAFGRDMKFIFWDNSGDSDILTITGNYNLDQDQILLEWYIVQNGQILKGPFVLSQSVAKKEEINKLIIDKVLLILNETDDVDE